MNNYLALSKITLIAIMSPAVLQLAGCDSNEAANNDQPADVVAPVVDRGPEPDEDVNVELSAPPADREIVSEATEAAKAAANASNAFGIDLFKRTTETTKAGNRFMSPVSAYLALAMAYNGATGETADQMQNSLALEDMSRDEINQASHDLMQTILGSDFESNIANSIWIREGFALDAEYASRVGKSYEATSKTLDFDSPLSAKQINRWVETQTRGRIPTIVDDLSSDLVALIVNAVYFKAKWQQPFETQMTKLGAFNAADGAVQVPMMGGDGNFRYLKTDDLELIELPYGREQQLASMVIVKPVGSLDSFVAGLTNESWAQMTSLLDAEEPARGTVTMPKLKLEFKASLSSPLMGMGMQRAFAGNAQFGDLLEGDARLQISDVIQKTFLEVDEAGTEAAAVTSIGVHITSMPRYAFQMNVDSPYFFAVRDNRTGAIMFAGAIHIPEGGEMPEE